MNQLRQLARAYRKPFAIFFRDDPPEALEDFPDLRRFFHVVREHGVKIEALPGELVDAVGEALVRRDVFEDLAVQPPLFTLRLDVTRPFDEVAATLRQTLSASWSEQRRLHSGNRARNWWTERVEALGALVFQFTAPLDQARGFSIAHERHPI
ncbi:MAG: hypothetical protein AAGA56_12385, partial [Myxococcota bacterium]